MLLEYCDGGGDGRAAQLRHVVGVEQPVPDERPLALAEVDGRALPIARRPAAQVVHDALDGALEVGVLDVDRVPVAARQVPQLRQRARLG